MPSCIQFKSDNLITRTPVEVENETFALEFYSKEKVGTIVLRDTSRSIKWKCNVGNISELKSHNSYKVNKNRLFFFNKKNKRLILNCLILKTGNIIWKKDLGENSDPITPQNLFLSEEIMTLIYKGVNKIIIKGVNVTNGEQIFCHKGNFLNSFIDIENLLYFPINDSVWRSLNITTGKLSDVSDSLNNYLGRPFLMKEKQFLYFLNSKSENIMKVDFYNYSFKPRPLIPGTVNKVESLSYDIFQNYFVFWTEINETKAQKVILQGLQSNYETKFVLPEGYKMTMDLTDISMYEEKSIHRNGDFLAFIMKNKEDKVRLFSIGGDEPTLDELSLPAVIRDSKYCGLNCFYRSDFYVFQMLMEDSTGMKFNIMLSYDFFSNKIVSIIKYNNQSYLINDEPCFYDGILYGIINNKKGRFYYDLDIVKSKMVHTDMNEDDYEIIPL